MAAASSAVTPMGTLESRLLMCVDHLGDGHLPDDIGTYPAAPGLVGPTIVATAVATATSGGTLAAGSPLTAVPVLNSRPGAFAKLYLDFDGDTTGTWGSYAPGTTPAYDQDGDPTTFSDGEVASMREVFNRVAEKYSPFNINVTTVNPGNLNNRETAKVVFGGDGAWLGSQAGGVAYVGGFTNSASNTVFVFTRNLSNGYAQYAAEAAAHEAGHGFGLSHQGQWSGTTLTSEYAPANAAGDAPIMGNSYTARRGLWWYGTTSNAYNQIQDDLAVIANTSTNGFGYRGDDFGGTIAAASALTLSGTSASAAGVIERTSDLDVFSFTSGAGSVSFSANRVTGGMLDAALTLQDAGGRVLASADTGNLNETLSANLAAQGTYYVTVGSHKGYGDVGQYTLSGTVAPVAATPLAGPTGAAAAAASYDAVDVSWADNAADETGFTVQRSADGGATWTDVGSVGANVTAYRDGSVAASTAYAYRVRAFDATRVSGWSNVASVTTPVRQTVPAAPSNLAARQLSTSAVRLTWSDNADNEAGFRVYASKDGGATWQALGTVGADVTSVDHTKLKRNQTWSYRVTAYNAAGESVASNTATASTALTPALALPGDANLDGTVNFGDLLVVSKNYNAAAAGGWSDGDFNGDGAVNFADLLALSKNYNATQATGDTVGGSEWGELTAVSADGQAVAALVGGTTARTSPAQVKAKLHAITAKRPAGVFSVRSIAKATVAVPG